MQVGLEEVVLLGVELEALGDLCADDAPLGNSIMDLVLRDPEQPLVAGLVLAYLPQIGAQAAEAFWTAIDEGARLALAGRMLEVDPCMAVRVIGIRQLAALLARGPSAFVQRRVAEGLCATVVPGSELCLALLEPSAQQKLACTLAERSAALCNDIPAWSAMLPDGSRKKCLRALALGALMAERPLLLERIIGAWNAQDWTQFQDDVQKRGAEISSSSAALLARLRPVETAGNRYGLERGASREIAGARDRQAPSDLLARVRGATALELEDLCQRAEGMTTAWREEIRRAVLVRAAALEHRISWREAAGFGWSERAIATLVARAERGDVKVFAKRTWSRLALDRRFSILSAFMAQLNVQVSVDPTTIRALGLAVAALPPAMRAILTPRLVAIATRTTLAASELTALLGEGTQMAQSWTATARVLSLHGETATSQTCLARARAMEDEASSQDGLRLLRALLNCPASVPVNSVEAATRALAGINSRHVAVGVELCRRHLPQPDRDVVLASLIAAGRTTAALAHVVA